jgi:hypothetical protein
MAGPQKITFGDMRASFGRRLLAVDLLGSTTGDLSQALRRILPGEKNSHALNRNSRSNQFDGRHGNFPQSFRQSRSTLIALVFPDLGSVPASNVTALSLRISSPSRRAVT